MVQRETDVLRTFAERLRDAGWSVALEVEEADVVAERDGHTLIAEVKGATSAPGLDVDTGYGQLLRRMSELSNTSYALVVPEPLERAAVRVPIHVLERLDIAVYVVEDSGGLRLGSGRDHARITTEYQETAKTVERDASPVDRFFSWVDAIPEELYPDELVPVAGRHVDGVAGFPAGRGLYAPCGWDHAVPPPFPYGGLMLVGNHLDSEDAYVEKLAEGAANGDPCPGARRMRFWNMLYALLDEAEIPREQIFVTNVHPALIRGRRPTGAIRGSDAWLQACERLLRRQIEVMRPRVIAGMGRPAHQFLERLMEATWSGVPELTETNIDGRTVGIAAIRHPSASQSLLDRSETASMLRAAME